MPRPHPVMPRVAHHPEAPPRDLFVPAVNERVGMNDRGRPSGSPLRHPRLCRADSMRCPRVPHKRTCKESTVAATNLQARNLLEGSG